MPKKDTFDNAEADDRDDNDPNFKDVPFQDTKKEAKTAKSTARVPRFEETEAAEPQPEDKLGPRKVRATQAGYIGHVYRHPGDVFTITQEADQKFSSTWMEDAPADEPEKITTAQKAINRDIRDLNARGEK